MQAIQDEIVGDYSPFVDSCVLSVRDCGGGEGEGRVQKSAHLVMLSGAPCSSGVVARKARREVGGHYDETGQWVGDDPALVAAARAEKDAENRARAARRARQTVLHRIKTIKADRLLTLTYRENMQERERLQRDWQVVRAAASQGAGLSICRRCRAAEAGRVSYPCRDPWSAELPAPALCLALCCRCG